MTLAEQVRRPYPSSTRRGPRMSRGVQARTAVPFLDLGSIHRDLKQSIVSDFADLIDSGAFINGPAVTEFETSFAGYAGVKHCVGVASGLDALRLGLIAAGVGKGDEVILPANTFVATIEAVVQAGATPVLADVCEEDYNLDSDAVTAALTPRTRALLPVHLYGQMADMTALERIARRHSLLLVEDACQAHGAIRDDCRAGTVGDFAAFSFYPAKNLGAMGDAGACVTDDERIASAVRALREHGQHRKYEHAFEGYTARLDTVQALVLLRKLPLLDRWNAQRQAAAAFYTANLRTGDLRLPPVPKGSMPVWHLFVVRTAEPERLATFLGERGISVGRHYPQPIHLTAAYAWLGHRRGGFPISERLVSEVISLPLYPGIAEVQLGAVVAAVEEYFRSG
jgi:dTDP-3-amino-3,4,6-trideoxy-alpha-D-glucose transaminase